MTQVGDSPLDAYRERREHEASRRVGKQTVPKELRDQLRGESCRVCSARPVEIHHVVPRARFGRRDPSVNDPANLVPICHRCHQNHHTTADHRIPRSALTDTEVAFAVDHAGPAWVTLWYPVDRHG